MLRQFVTRMHKFIVQSDVKHIMMSPIRTIKSVLKASTDIITNIPAHPMGQCLSRPSKLPLFYKSYVKADNGTFTDVTNRIFRINIGGKLFK